MAFNAHGHAHWFPCISSHWPPLACMRMDGWAAPALVLTGLSCGSKTFPTYMLSLASSLAFQKNFLDAHTSPLFSVLTRFSFWLTHLLQASRYLQHGCFFFPVKSCSSLGLYPCLVILSHLSGLAGCPDALTPCAKA